MNNFPRLGFFDVDPERFDAMMKELTDTGAIAMANYEDDEWIDVDDDAGDFDMSYYNDHTYEEDNEDYYDDSMDGDFDSAMASAGFGTDEDYGLYDDYDDFYGEDY